MIKVLLSGCNGKMGRAFTRVADKYEDLEIVAGFDISDAIPNSYPVYKNAADIAMDIDAIVDFSHPSALSAILDYAVSKKIPIVLPTTGYSAEQKEEIKAAAAKVPVFQSANMSLGVNLMIELVKKTAGLLGSGFDIEIIEKHHNQKVDAPSGTALMLADAMNQELDGSCAYVYDRHLKREKRSNKEIGIHAVRGGTIVGEHTVIFAGNDEVIEVKHTATSKEVFAEGAVRAVRFLIGMEPGLYAMQDMIKV